jgi:hypothetical protein
LASASAKEPDLARFDAGQSCADATSTFLSGMSVDFPARHGNVAFWPFADMLKHVTEGDMIP